jgi:hypothetical protein
MQEQVADLEPQADASASSELDERFGKSVDTGVIEPEAETVEVETETEEAEEEPESEVESSPTEEEDLDEKTDPQEDEEFSANVKARIDELTAKWRDTERALSARDIELAELRKQLEERPVAEEPFKTLADFEYDEGKYQQYLGAEITRRAEEAGRQAALGVTSEMSTQTSLAAFKAREIEFAKTVKDYDLVAHDRSLPINDAMANAIQYAENGPELAYYLGKHPEEARRISDLPAPIAGFELRDIAAKLKSDRESVKPPKVSKAPPPPPKVKAGDGGLPKGFYEGMSDAEFAKMRRKQIANR